MPTETPVHWIGTSKKDLLAFPEQAVADIGYALGVAQLGGKHPDAKPWKGNGPGVLEIVEAFDGNAYRLVSRLALRKRFTCCTRFRRSRPRALRPTGGTRN